MKIRYIIVLLLAVVLLATPASAWYQDYQYRIVHNITGSSTWIGNLTDYQMSFNVYSSGGVSSGSTVYLGTGTTQADYDDIRFTDSDDNLLNYTHFSTESGYAVFWVKFPEIVNSSTTNTTLYIYFGNSTATSSSNFTNTFIFADPFEDSTVDPQWTTTNLSSVSEGTGRLSTTGNSYTYDNMLAAAIATTSISGNYSVVVSSAWEGQESYPDLGQGYLYLKGSTDTAYIGWEDNSAVANQYYKCAFNTKTYSGSAAGTHSGSSTFEIRKNASSIYLFQGTNLLMSNTTTDTFTSLRLVHTRYDDYSGKTNRWYYVYAKKYVTTEPTHGSYTTAQCEPEAQWRTDYTKGGIISGTGPTFHFIDQSNGTPTSWNWSFGDGEYSTDQNPFHTYDAAGNYSVNLTISSFLGTDYNYKPSYIYVENYNFARSVAVRVNGSSNYDVFDYTVKWDIHNSSGTCSGNDYYSFSGNMTTDYDDIRFVTVNNTYAPHWIDWTDTDSDQVLMWSKYYHIPMDSGIVAYIMSGNASAPSVEDPDNAFLMFENFEWNNFSRWDLAMSDWQIQSTTVKSGTYTGLCHVNVIESPNSILYRNKTFHNVSYGGWFRTNKFHEGDPGTVGCGNFFMIGGSFENTTGNAQDGTMVYLWSAQDFSEMYFDGLDQDPWEYPSHVGLSINTWYKFYGEYDTESVHAHNRLWIGANYVGEANIRDALANIQYDSNSFRLFRWSGSAGWDPDDHGANGYDDTFVDDLWMRNYTSPEPNQTAWAEGILINNWTTDDDRSGPDPLTVNFYDDSYGSTPKLYMWDLDGDGTIDNTTRNASWTYSVKQYYNVSHYVSDGVTSEWNNETNYVYCSGSAPDAEFHANLTSGIAPIDILFTDDSSNSPTSWNWSFGDGNYSNDQNPEHTYSFSGYFNVSLNATNADGSDIETKTDYINVSSPLPVAAFSANVTSGDRPLAVAFTDSSTNTPSSWNWSFGDSFYSNSQNPTHTYSTAGIYTVILTATNGYGSDGETKNNYITVSSVEPVAAFGANITSGQVPLAVQFMDASTNATSWNWSFGDGTFSNSQNPVHTYSIYGSYTVNLTATNVDGSDVEAKIDYITAADIPVAAFSASTLYGDIPLVVHFNDSSTGSPTSWSWDIGNDGFADNVTRNCSWTFNAYGSYTIRLTVSNVYGSDTETKFNYIVTASTGPTCFNITTWEATSASEDSVTLNGRTNETTDVWFALGSTPASLSYYTESEETTGNYSTTVDDYPFVLGQTYYYAATSACGRGEIKAFAIPAATPIPTTTYTSRFDDLVDARANWSALAPIIGSVYTDLLGVMVYAIIWLAIIGAIWIRTEDARLPLFAYILISLILSLNNVFPASVVNFIYVSIVIAFAGMIYPLMKGSQKTQ